MSIVIFLLIAMSLYFRFAKFDSHNFMITVSVSLSTFLFFGIAALLLDYSLVQSSVSILANKMSILPKTGPMTNSSWLYLIGYEIITLFLILTFLRFVVDLSHAASIAISTLAFTAFNIVILGVASDNLQAFINTDAGVVTFWVALIFLLAILVALLGPVLAMANLVVLVAIYGYQVDAVSNLAQYLHMETMVGVVGGEKIILFIIISTAIASIDTVKSMFER